MSANTRVAMLVVMGGLALAVPRPARACGGFFCDSPISPNVPPIAQAGENVVFAMGRDPTTGKNQVEAHIQIIYTGTADKFSWVVPVLSAPTVDVGTDLLFQRIEPATRPTFQVSYQQDGTCQGQSSNSGIGCGSASSAAGVKDTAGGGPTSDKNVQIISQGNIGPYDYVVVAADDPQTLSDFLTSNGYYVSTDASKIIDEYVAAHDAFVAVRLSSGQDTTAIRPIILRFTADEACLPLKLTAIAATPDMRINVWVLADARAVPLTYTEISIDMAKVDWLNSAQNYDQIVSQAADEAGGNAFLVEYAQSSTATSSLFTPPATSLTSLDSITYPPTYLSALLSAGLPPTGDVLAVLRRHLPEPAQLAASGVTETQFYQNLTTYYTGMPAFDPVATTTDLDMTVLQPLAEVEDLFRAHPYLTRLATFISPEEMTKDPLFVSNPDLPDVSQFHQAIAHVQCGDQEFSFCNAPVRLELVDEKQDVWFRSASGTCPRVYDRTDIDTLPSSEMGWRRDPQGTGDVILDNRAAIATALTTHNGPVISSLSSGCGCSVRGRKRPVGLGLVVLGAALLCVRRRRARS
jgi:hypothetical protein